MTGNTPSAECSLCSAPATEISDNGYLREDCALSGDSDPEVICSRQKNQEFDHENLADVGEVTNAERVQLLRHYLEAHVDEFGRAP